MDAIQVKQAIRKDTPCPFGHDLSKVRLTLFEKYWLGSRIVFNRSTAAKLSKRFSLTYKTFRKFAKACRDGTMLNSKDGRPRTFDDVSCKSIRDVAVKELKLDTPDF